ncbi:MAG: ATP-binding protein, partial [Planctomycetaceae bacterium]|nr:ATP-binding protein [Planctomycetaceae bacterium]
SVDLWKEAAMLVPEYFENTIDIWEECDVHWSPDLEFDQAADPAGAYADLSSDMTKSNSYRSWRKQLRDFIYRDVTLPLWQDETSDLYSTPEETESGFRMRVVQAIREQNDLEVEKLKAKFKSKFESQRDRVLRAEEKVKREEAQYKEKSYMSLVSIGSSILGALMGRKIASQTNVSKGATAIRSASRAAAEKADIQLAEDKLEQEQAKLKELEIEFDAEVEKLEQRIAPDSIKLEEYPIRPRKSDINVADVALLWMPFAIHANGAKEALFTINE